MTTSMDCRDRQQRFVAAVGVMGKPAGDRGLRNSRTPVGTQEGDEVQPWLLARQVVIRDRLCDVTVAAVCEAGVRRGRG